MNEKQADDAYSTGGSSPPWNGTSQKHYGPAFQPTTGEVSAYYSYRVPRLARAGGEWRGPCPIHGGKRDSFAVSPQTGLWHCHSECQDGGDIVKLEMLLHGEEFKEALAAVQLTVGRKPPTASKRTSNSDSELGPIVATYD